MAKPLYPVINATTAPARREGVPVVWLNWGARADLLNVHPSHRRMVRPAPGDPSYEPRMNNGKDPVLELGSWGAAVIPELDVAGRGRARGETSLHEFLGQRTRQRPAQSGCDHA